MSITATTSTTPALKDFSFAPTEDLSDLGGAGKRFERNVAVIQLLKQLEAEGRVPGDLTVEEQ